ncbi:hypothetical protein ILUMI_11519 [Ignelater luminosus]|uniref:C2H2-type domain-containing protein n=1 Tax=Ignelater luminosus TaxID=2038154 RepID=A0A8K0GDV6_IGNLU|nr:hypothetical protein ILUMI_11519 [Ignelater luminosus]
MRACQACLKLIEDGKPLFYLSDIYVDPIRFTSDTITIKDKLTDCVPELLLDSVPNGILCELCINLVMIAYEFRQRCLETQHKIYGYLQQMPTNTKIDVNEIAIYYNRLEIIAKGGNPFATESNKGISVSSVTTTRGEQNTYSKPFENNTSSVCNQSSQNEQTHYLKVGRLCNSSPQDNNLNGVDERIKSFPCKICNKVFLGELNLKNHSAAVHPDPLLRCHICKFVTRKRIIMRRHKNHHKKKKMPYACIHCDYRTRLSQALSQHVKDKHYKSKPTPLRSSARLLQNKINQALTYKESLRSPQNNLQNEKTYFETFF